MKNFERFVAIDWSGAKSPIHTKSIAVALSWHGEEAPHLSGRLWSRNLVYEWLCSLAAQGKRTLVGIDCNFGYSEQTGIEQFGKEYTAADLWRAVDDANTNEPNFFAGGFWTHPHYERYFWCSGTMPDGFLMPRRQTEIMCGQSGLGWPESPFKLIGPKQVGKGGLAGMRMAYALKRALGEMVSIWPFEPENDQAVLVLTEIYPRLFLRKSGHGNAKIHEYSALNRALRALGSNPSEDDGPLSDHEADAMLSAAGLRELCERDKTIPQGLSNPPIPRTTLVREGWIFGVGA